MPDNIIIDFVIGDNGIEDAIDELVRLGQVDKEVAAQFKTATVEFKKQLEAIKSGAATSTTGLKKSFTDLIATTKSMPEEFRKGIQEGLADALTEAGLSAADLANALDGIDSGTGFKNIRDELKDIISQLEQARAGTKHLTDDELKKLEARAIALKKAIDDTKNSTRVPTTGFKTLSAELADIKRQLNEVNAGQRNLSDEKVAELVARAKELNAALEETKNQLKEPPDDGFSSIKQELKEIKIALSEARLGTRTFTDGELVALKTRAAEIEDAIQKVNRETRFLGSDTRGIDGLIAGARGIAGGFEIAEGVTALFGDENENLQKTMVRLQSAMATLQGLQEVSNLLNKDSIALKFLDRQATAAQAVAQKAYTFVVGESTGALKAFKLALAATGIGLLLLLIGALVANWDKIKETIGGVSDEQKKLNADAKKSVEHAEENLKKLDEQDAILKSQGKSERDILLIKRDRIQKVIDEREQMILLQKQTLEGQISAAKRNQDILAGILRFINIPLSIVIDTVNRVAKFLGSDFKLPTVEDLAKQIFDPEETRKQGEEELKAANEELDKIKNARAQNQLDITANDREKFKERQEEFRKSQEQQLKDQVAVLEARLENTKSGSEEELALQKKLLIAKANLELNSEEITAAGRAAINAKLHSDLLQAEEDFENNKQALKIKAIDDQLANVGGDLQKEFNLRKQLLAEQLKLDLNNRKIGDDEKKRLQQKFNADTLALQKDFTQRLAAEAIQDQISLNNAQLQNVKIGAKEKLDLQIENILLAAQAEVDAANGNAEKIKEINARRDADILELRKQFIEAAAEYEIALEAAKDGARRRGLERTVDNEKKSVGERISALEQLTAINVGEIDKQVQAEKDLLGAKTISQEEYNLKVADLDDKRSQIEENGAIKREQIEKEHFQKLVETIAGIANQVADVFGQLSDLSAAKDEQRIKSMQTALDEAKEAGAITEKEANARQKRIDNEERKAKTAQAQREKNIAIFQAIINTAAAVVKALATGGPVLAAIVGALGAVQIGIIAARPLPKFNRGKRAGEIVNGPLRVNGDGYAQIAEEAPEFLQRGNRLVYYPRKTVAFIKQSDVVYNPKETMKLMNSFVHNVDHEILKIPVNEINNRIDIDYKRLGKEIRKNSKPVNINVDANGVSVQEGLSKMNYFNNRYSMKVN